MPIGPDGHYYTEQEWKWMTMGPFPDYTGVEAEGGAIGPEGRYQTPDQRSRFEMPTVPGASFSDASVGIPTPGAPQTPEQAALMMENEQLRRALAEVGQIPMEGAPAGYSESIQVTGADPLLTQVGNVRSPFEMPTVPGASFADAAASGLPSPEAPGFPAEAQVQAQAQGQPQPAPGPQGMPAEAAAASQGAFNQPSGIQSPFSGQTSPEVNAMAGDGGGDMQQLLEQLKRQAIFQSLANFGGALVAGSQYGNAGQYGKALSEAPAPLFGVDERIAEEREHRLGLRKGEQDILTSQARAEYLKRPPSRKTYRSIPEVHAAVRAGEITSEEGNQQIGDLNTQRDTDMNERVTLDEERRAKNLEVSLESERRSEERQIRGEGRRAGVARGEETRQRQIESVENRAEDIAKRADDIESIYTTKDSFTGQMTSMIPRSEAEAQAELEDMSRRFRDDSPDVHKEIERRLDEAFRGRRGEQVEGREFPTMSQVLEFVQKMLEQEQQQRLAPGE